MLPHEKGAWGLLERQHVKTLSALARLLSVVALFIAACGREPPPNHGCRPGQVPACPPDGGTPPPSNNVTMVLDNTTPTAQRFQPTGFVLDGATGETTATWDPGIITVEPGQQKTFPNVIYAPVGSRVGVDVWLLADDPSDRSGGGYSVGVLRDSPITCTIWTTGLAPPNGVRASCTY